MDFLLQSATDPGGGDTGDGFQGPLHLQLRDPPKASGGRIAKVPRAPHFGPGSSGAGTLRNLKAEFHDRIQ